MKLSQEQKKMAKHGAIQSIALAITMVIIVPLIKGENLSMPNTLIEFMIYIIIIYGFHWIFIIGSRIPKQ